MSLDALENATRWIGVATGVTSLAVMLWQGVGQGWRHPTRRTSDGSRFLTLPMQLLFGVLWIGLCFALWQPVPVLLASGARAAALGLGTLLFWPGLALYWWGARTLGGRHRASSAFGVSPDPEHRLVTSGPFGWVRHPLYLGLQLAGVGGFLLYRTWTFVFVAASFLALVFRAKREEQALAKEFGEMWEEYARKVPAWIPRFGRRAN